MTNQNFKMLGAAALTALTAFLATAAGNNAAAQAEPSVLQTVPAGDRVIGLVAPDQPVQFLLQLPYHDQAGLDVLQQRLYTPGDPLFHQ
ncbi:MAG TPA: hypothetical protein VNX47_06495, partial [Nevskia sp.]|nr:hypothetical protein [Nevskia sp.]